MKSIRPINIILKITVLLAFSVISLSRHKVSAQSYDVFVPIAKYFAAADEQSLSAWFAPSLEISIFGPATDASKAQARQILKSFFKNYPPRSFNITHQAGRETLKYAVGELSANGEHFLVTIFVSMPRSGGTFQIQQLKIDRI